MATMSVVSDVPNIRRISRKSVDVCLWRPILLGRCRESTVRGHGVLSGGTIMDYKTSVTREEVLLTVILVLATITLTVVS